MNAIQRRNQGINVLEQLQYGKSEIKQEVLAQSQKPFIQEAINLHNFLDVNINTHDKTTNLRANESHFQDNGQILEQTLIEQRKDIDALQQIEKSRLQIQNRIKERYSLLRSISSKARSRKTNSHIPPQDLILQKPISNARGSTMRYEQNPYCAQIMHKLPSQKRKIKKQNMTTLINPSTIEYYSGRISSALYPPQHNMSPTALSKASTINNQSLINEAMNNLQAKKVQKIQKKKIVIKENTREFSPIRDRTPTNIHLQVVNIEPTLKSKQHGGYSQLKPRPISNRRLTSQSRDGRSTSVSIKQNRNKNASIYPKRPIIDNNAGQNTQIFAVSPVNHLLSKVQESYDSERLDPYETNKGNIRYNQVHDSKEFQLSLQQPSLISIKDNFRLSQGSSNYMGENPSFNIRQKLNFRYIPTNGTINNEREDEEELTNTRRKLQESKTNEAKDDKKEQKVLLNEINDQIQELYLHDEPNFRESIFNTPSTKYQQPVMFQSSIIAENKHNLKKTYETQESAGMSKTTISTQRPLLSGVSLIGGQVRKISKTKILGGLTNGGGRFSSDNSFLRLRQTLNNKQSVNEPNVQDDDQKDDQKLARISHDQVIQIQEEEENFEDEESKSSSNHKRQQQSQISTRRILPARRSTRNYQKQQEMLQKEDSSKNILDLQDLKGLVSGEVQESKQGLKPIATDESHKKEILHSDDEVSVRRGLEPSTFRSQIPDDPELLRQSTHSLLNRTRGRFPNNGPLQQQLDETEVLLQEEGYDLNDVREVEVFVNSYDSYLKNADNFMPRKK